MESVTGFENSSISPNPAGKLFMNTDLVGFVRRTGFAAKSQDFSPHKMFMNTNSGHISFLQVLSNHTVLKWCAVRDFDLKTITMSSPRFPCYFGKVSPFYLTPISTAQEPLVPFIQLLYLCTLFPFHFPVNYIFISFSITFCLFLIFPFSYFHQLHRLTGTPPPPGARSYLKLSIHGSDNQPAMKQRPPDPGGAERTHGRRGPEPGEVWKGRHRPGQPHLPLLAEHKR